MAAGTVTTATKETDAQTALKFLHGIMWQLKINGDERNQIETAFNIVNAALPSKSDNSGKSK